jgi:hypothetical protein
MRGNAESTDRKNGVLLHGGAEEGGGFTLENPVETTKSRHETGGMAAICGEGFFR